MNPILAKINDILPGILRNAIPVPSGPGYVLELEGAEMDALRELADALSYKGEYWVDDVRDKIRMAWKPFRNGEEGHTQLPTTHCYRTEIQIHGQQMRFDVCITESQPGSCSETTTWPLEVRSTR